MNENVANKFDPFAILDEARLQRQINSITGDGGSALTITDGTTTVDDVTQLTVSGATVGGSSPDATLTITGGGGGGNTITLTADTDIAAGTAVAINSSGHAVQTWGPAPNVDGLVTLFNPGIGPTLVLDENHFVTFQINGSAGPVGAMACSIASEVINCGTIDTSVQNANAGPWGPSSASFANAVVLSSTLYVVAYNDPTSGNLTLGANSILANVISAGTPVQVATQAGASIALGSTGLLALNATQFVYVYGLIDNSAFAVVGTVLGNTITLGTPVQITPSGGTLTAGNSQYWTPSILLMPTTFLTVYQDTTNSGNATAVIGTILGTTITLGTPALVGFVVPNNFQLQLVGLTPTSFMFYDGNITFYGGAISGGAISFGSGAAIGNAGFANGFMVGLNSTQAVFYGSNAPAGPLLLTMSGLSVGIGAPYQIPPGDLRAISGGNYVQSTIGSIAVCGDVFIFTDNNLRIYEENGDGIVSQSIHHQFLVNYWLYALNSSQALATLGANNIAGNIVFSARVINIQPINVSGPVAFASAAVASGNPGIFQVAGAVNGFSGLTPGASHYVNGDGTLTTANTGHLAGVALSATELLIAA